MTTRFHMAAYIIVNIKAGTGNLTCKKVGGTRNESVSSTRQLSSNRPPSEFSQDQDCVDF